MTQWEYCQKAMQWVAKKCQPIESPDKGPEDIDIDQDHKNFTNTDIPLETYDPQVELGPEAEQSASSVGQTQEAQDRWARVEEIEDEEVGVQNRCIQDFPGNVGKQGDQAQSYFEKLHAK